MIKNQSSIDQFCKKKKKGTFKDSKTNVLKLKPELNTTLNLRLLCNKWSKHSVFDSITGMKGWNYHSGSFCSDPA